MSKKPNHTDEPPSVAYADGWVEKLRKHLPETVTSWDAEAIHQSRVATRRLKAALDVLEPILAKSHRKSLAKALRKLRHQLGPLRDLDVMLDHLRAMRPGPGVTWLRITLDAQRDAGRRKTADALDPPKALAKLGSWWGVRQEWVDAGDAVDDLMAHSVHLQLDAFVEHANGVTSPGERASNSDRDPHQLRIAGKALRYTLEMAVAAGHPLQPAVAQAFKRMQDALGAWHDMVVLAERALRATLDAQLAYHDASRHLAVCDVAKAAVQRSARQMATFTELWSAQGAALTDTVRAAFPLTQDAAGGATESQTGRGPHGSAGSPHPGTPPQDDPEAA